MWCKHCGQDVPGLSSAGGELCCLRCGAALLADSPARAAGQHSSIVAEAIEESQPQRPGDLDQWQLERDVRHLRKLVAEWPGTAATDGRQLVPEADRLPLPPRHVPAAHWSRKAEAVPSTMRQPRWGWLAWMLIAPSLMALVCGGVLIGWSLWEQRTELWNLGLPITIGGQIGLLLGLVLQLERMGRGHRDAAQRLQAVNNQLHDLRHTTTLLGTTHGSAAKAFYAHLAEGANPEILLADLKGQLDLLATTMAEHRR